MVQVYFGTHRDDRKGSLVIPVQKEVMEEKREREREFYSV